MNMFTFTINFCCILFWGILVIVYFSKKNMSNIENKIYKYIIILDFMVLVFHFLGLIVAYYLDFNKYMMDIYKILARFYCVSEAIWCVFFECYTIIIINEFNEKYNKFFYKNKKKIITTIVIFTILISLITFILPVNYSFSEKNILMYVGPRVDFLTYFLIVLGFIGSISIMLNLRKINIKKVLPFVLFVILQILALLLYFVDSSISIFTLAITLISYLMYHTIENPDIKLIAQLELAKNQAEKSSEAKSDFLNSISYEIKNPINDIVGLSQIMVSSTNKDDIRSDSKDIFDASQNLLGIVNGILDLNKLESNKMEIINNKYNPRVEFDNIVKMIKIKIGDKPLELISKYSDDLPIELIGDKNKLKQIITNLLTNAVKYTDKGFIYFNVNCKNIRDKCELTISVRDTGRGIKEENIEHLFNRFNNSNYEENVEIEGTGLGLAITKSIIEMFDGNINVSSIYGQGSTFTVNIKQEISEFSSLEKSEEANESNIIDVLI